MAKPVQNLLVNLRIKMIRDKIPTGATVCDIGCGNPPIFLNTIKDRLNRGIGLDKDAENKTEGKIETKQISISDKISLPESSVDIITMLAVLEHMDNDKAVLKECFRILKPGGKILITVPTHTNKPIGEFLAFKLKLINEDHYRDHKRYYNKTELVKRLKEAGFERTTANYWELGMNLFAEGYKKSQA